MYQLFIKLLLLNLFVSLVFAASTNSTSYEAPEAKPKSTSVKADPKPEAETDKSKGFINRIADNMTGSLALTSNYIFRGLTQTENLPAVQGEYTYTFPFGLYATVWASNDKFIDTDITLEIDPGIGFYKEINDDFNFDISVYRYYFPSDKIWNYSEWLGQVNFKFLQTNLGYSNNVFGAKRSGFYYDGGINYTLPAKLFFGIEKVNLLALAGRYILPKNFPDITGISYNNYTVALSKDFKHYNVALQYSNTTERDYYAWYGGEHFFCTLTATF
jgi:uncharacterized protein (TIGR02001 family)